MPLVDALYEWLAAQDTPEADWTLGSALEHAEAPYAARIVRLLVQRARPSAWGALIASYDRLDPQVRQTLQSRPELLQTGIAAALVSAADRGRERALALLAERPCPTLSYVVVGALRDPSVRIRDAAAKVLRLMADKVLSDSEGVTSRLAGPESAAQRAALVESLREALRSPDLRRRAEVLEVSLWFARELGEGLWNVLSGRSSQRGHLVEQRLASWNHPRLAGFLLLGLGRLAWRAAAAEMLQAWSTREELIALLRHSDLLGDPRVQEGLRALRHPRWLLTASSALADLPPNLRACLPRWILYLAMRDTERIRWLRVWLASPFPELRRAATYALAALRSPPADQLLLELSARSGSTARFVRWVLAGRPLVARPCQREFATPNLAKGGPVGGVRSAGRIPAMGLQPEKRV